MGRQWVARAWEIADDTTRLRSQLTDARKEHNTTGEVDTEPADWLRRVGFWCD